MPCPVFLFMPRRGARSRSIEPGEPLKLSDRYRIIQYIVPPEYDGKKAVAFLRGGLKLSARLTASLKRVEGGITRGGETLRTVDLLRAGDEIRLRMPEKPANVTAKPIPLSIVYEDDDLLVIDKPAGLAMHPTHNHQGDTLANGVIAHLDSQGKAPVFKAVGWTNTHPVLLSAR